LDEKHVVNIIENKVRIYFGQAVFDASAIEVSQCKSFSRRFNFWQVSRHVAHICPLTVYNFLKHIDPHTLIKCKHKQNILNCLGEQCTDNLTRRLYIYLDIHQLLYLVYDIEIISLMLYM